MTLSSCNTCHTCGIFQNWKLRMEVSRTLRLSRLVKRRTFRFWLACFSAVHSDFPWPFGWSWLWGQLVARFTPSFDLSISLLESEEHLHVCTLGSRGPFFDQNARIYAGCIGVERCNYYWRNLIWRFSHQSATRQIKVPAEFSGLMVIGVFSLDG